MNNRAEFIRETIVWIGLYLFFVLAPLALALTGHTKGHRGFWIEFGVGLGFTGIALMGMQFVLTARFKSIAAPFGTDILLNFHRQAGYIAWFFILGHVSILILANNNYLSFFDPRVNAPRALALAGVIILMTLLVALTIWRKQLKLSYEWWRLSHAVFAFLILMIGLAHILMVGFYISEIWQQIFIISLTGVAMGLLIHVRIVKPYKMGKKPYNVTDIRQETPNIRTIEVEARHHPGITFEAGQFAWLTIGESPFSLQQHPFSFASSAKMNGRYWFTIKELGDFTSSVKNIEIGTNVYIEGAYGAFTLKPDSDGAFFIVGGIGITPVISMLRTLCDKKDERPLTLIYGNPDITSIPFRNELSQLENELNLKVLHVLENPPNDWSGYKGLITAGLIKKYLPDTIKTCDYYVCGPEPLMDLTEVTLRKWNVPLYKLHSERFNIV